MPSLEGLKRRLRRATPAPCEPPAPSTLHRGHPDNPLTANLLDRRRLGEALDALALDRDAPAALSQIAAITALRPGLAPEGLPEARLEGLILAAERLPQNLSVRVALAEALARSGQPQEARRLAVSAIRDSRPRDLLNRAPHVSDDFAREPAGAFFHSVDLGDAFIDGVTKTAVVTARETLLAHWPDLRGKSVLDIGAFGGWFAFEAERRGAARVTANDYYSWMVDFPKVWAWMAEQRAAGLEPDPYHAPYPVNDPQGQPGRRIFDLTREALGSRVEPVFGSIDDAPLEPHDVVLLLGVLYHHENPLALLRRVFALTRETLILETLSFEYPANLAAPIWHFYPGGDVSRDSTTVWAPSSMGLKEALLKVGFSRVELVYGWDGSGLHADWNTLEARLWVHAHR